MPHTDLPSPNEIAAAAQRLMDGELVAFATETVYGLGADAEQVDAVARIYAAKGRPSNHPVIVHLAPGADLSYWAAQPVPDVVNALVAEFWPGPLTLIVERNAQVSDAVSGGQSSIGVRCPSHPVAQALLTAFANLKPNGQGGVAAPSANRFGHVSPTLAQHVVQEFPEEIAAGMPVLQGGASDIGIESTILDVSGLDAGRPATLLRPGAISAAQLANVLGYTPAAPDANSPRASGTLKAHYAPRTPVQLVTAARLGEIVGGIDVPDDAHWVVLSFVTAPAGIDPRITWRTLGATPDAYARMLYASLRDLDTGEYDRLIVQQPPDTALWRAVNDRIGRAAAAFDSPQAPPNSSSAS